MSIKRNNRLYKPNSDTGQEFHVFNRLRALCDKLLDEVNRIKEKIDIDFAFGKIIGINDPVEMPEFEPVYEDTSVEATEDKDTLYLVPGEGMDIEYDSFYKAIRIASKCLLYAFTKVTVENLDEIESWQLEDNELTAIADKKNLVIVSGDGIVIYVNQESQAIKISSIAADSPPIVGTSMVDNFVRNKATAHGIIYKQGANGVFVTERGFVWSLRDSEEIPDYYNAAHGHSEAETSKDGELEGHYNQEVGNFASEEYYLIRAYAINKFGIGYGSTKLIKSNPLFPETYLLSINDITAYTALCMGQITEDYDMPILERGFVWKQSNLSDPTYTDSRIVVGSDVGVFESYIGKGTTIDDTPLQPGKPYRIRAYAKTVDKISYSAMMTFISASLEPPVTAISDVKNIRQRDALLVALPPLTEVGTTIVKKGFIYGDSDPAEDPLDVIEVTGAFELAINGLSAGTIYYVKAYAENEFGGRFSELRVFVTPDATVPEVLTLWAEKVTSSEATLVGSLVYDCGADIIARGFAYTANTGHVPDKDNDSYVEVVGDDFKAIISDLTPGRKYHYRAYATNSVGTSYGALKIFAATPIDVVTGDIDTLTYDEGTIYTWVNSELEIIERGLVIALSSYSGEPELGVAGCTTYQGTEVVNGGFQESLDGLDPGTSYKVRSYAIFITEYGVPNITQTVYGETKQITTLSVTEPEVLVDFVFNVSQTTASVKILLLDNGGNEITGCGITYQKGEATPIEVTGTLVGNGFVVELSSLDAGSEYGVKGFVSYGVSDRALSTLVTFNTTPADVPIEDSSPIITTYVATDVSYYSFMLNGFVLSSRPLVERGFLIGTITSYTDPKLEDVGSYVIKKVDTDAISGNYSILLTDLVAPNSYYYRSYAIYDTDKVVYGDVRQVYTPNREDPVFSGSMMNLIGETTAEFKSNLVHNGGWVVVDKGICYKANTAGDPTISDSHLEDDDVNLGEYYVLITGLTAGATYKARSYVKYEYGAGYQYSYGSVVTFTMLPGRGHSIFLDLITSNDISYKTISLRGTAQTDGTITVLGFLWKRTSDPTVDSRDGYKNVSPAPGGFSATTTTLLVNTEYRFRAYMVVDGVTYYSSVKSASTLDYAPPKVSTLQVASIGTTSAKSGGTVLSTGGRNVYSRGILWSASSSIPDYTSYEGIDTDSETGLGTYYGDMTDLLPNTTYYVRAFGIYSIGAATNYAYGVVFTFKTLSIFDMQVVTMAAEDVSLYSATLKGMVIAGHTITEKGFCIKSGAGDPVRGTDYYEAVSSGQSSFEYNIDVLAKNTSYNFRSYVIVDSTVYYGETKSFTTLSGSAPDVITKEVSSISYMSAYVGGIVTNDNGSEVIEKGVAYSVGASGAINIDTASYINYSQSLDDEFGVKLSLSPGTGYKAVAFAINIFGVGYGAIKYFSTEASLYTADVETLNVFEITNTSARIGGIVDVMPSGYAITVRGICYRLGTSEPTVANTVVTAGAGAGTFYAQMTSLSENTTYTVRAYAKSNTTDPPSTSKASYGVSRTFTTSKDALTI